MLINPHRREISFKLVYYGPGLSGKTTNLQVIHKKAPGEKRGELTEIATEGDRTLFFDFMPLELGTVNGLRTKFQLYTVPGQRFYDATRKLVLQGADGVVFVADSQPGKMAENVSSLENLEQHLAEQGLSLDELPFVIQWNKRDLPDALAVEDLERKLNRRGVPTVEAVAVTGEGVFATLKTIVRLVLEKFARDHSPRARPASPERGLAESGVAEGPRPKPVKKIDPRPTRVPSVRGPTPRGISPGTQETRNGPLLASWVPGRSIALVIALGLLAGGVAYFLSLWSRR